MGEKEKEVKDQIERLKGARTLEEVKNISEALKDSIKKIRETEKKREEGK